MKNKPYLMLTFFLLPCCILFSPASQGVFADTAMHPDVQQVLKCLQQRYDNTEDISALFIQETYSPGASRPVSARGNVYFRRPQMMRWEYVKPDPQLIVTSDTDVYVYEKEEQQVMILPRKQFLSSEISRAFFSGKGSLENYFKVSTDKKCNIGARWCLRLTPLHDSGSLKELRLVIDPESHLIKEMWISDEMGSRTHLRFRDIRVNQNLSPELFRFTVPRGVEVYHTDQD